MKIIGISGKKKSGKDTIANIICAMNDGVNIKYAFATELKKEVAHACNCSVTFIDTNKDLFRPILQWWGTEYRRNLFGRDYWIRKMRAALEHMKENGVNLVVIPDVRFENEFEFIKYELKAPVYRVERISNFTNGYDIHPSEIALDGETFDFVVQNNGTINQLIDEVKRTVKL